MPDTNPIEGILETEGNQILNHIQDVELDPMEVNKLFTHPNPYELSPAQRAVIVSELRKSRATYIKRKAEKRKKAAAKSTVTKSGFDLKDLNLNIEDLMK